MKNKVCVIVPCYNEEKSIGNAMKKISSFLSCNPDYRFIFVDDGSQDGTLKILTDTIKRENNRNMDFISYKKNQGKGHAIRTGVSKVEEEFICFIDADLAYSLETIKTLVNALACADVAIGNRGLNSLNSDRVPGTRKIIGVVYNFFVRAILRVGFKDTQAGIKGFRKLSAKKLFSTQQINSFSFDAELLYLAKKFKYRVVEIPAVVLNKESYGESKVRLFRDSIKMFICLIKIRMYDLKGKYG